MSDTQTSALDSIPKQKNRVASNLLNCMHFGVESLELGKGNVEKVEEAKDGLVQCLFNSTLRTAPMFKKATVQIVTLEEGTGAIVHEAVHQYETEHRKCPAIIANNVIRKSFAFSKWGRITCIHAYYVTYPGYVKLNPPVWTPAYNQGANVAITCEIRHHYVCSQEELESGVRDLSDARCRVQNTPRAAYDGTIVIRVELTVA